MCPKDFVSNRNINNNFEEATPHPAKLDFGEPTASGKMLHIPIFLNLWDTCEIKHIEVYLNDDLSNSTRTACGGETARR